MRVSEATLIQTDGWTDKTKLVGVIYYYANMPKIVACYR